MVTYTCDKCGEAVLPEALKRMTVQMENCEIKFYKDLCLLCQADFKKNLTKFFNMTKGGLNK